MFFSTQGWRKISNGLPNVVSAEVLRFSECMQSSRFSLTLLKMFSLKVWVLYLMLCCIYLRLYVSVVFFLLTCKQSEVTRASDCNIGWCDISSFYTILSHLVEIWCVHIPVIIPSESIKGDEQQLVSSCCTGFFSWSTERWRNCKQPKTYCQ